MNSTIESLIAEELSVKTQQVAAAIKLIDDGATIPFIARYRKEATDCLDDIQLRQLDERLVYLRDLEERRSSILKIIADQENLTPELRQSIVNATTKTELEDLYLPFKPKRRSKASVAREAGLEVLAQKLLDDPSLNPEQVAGNFINDSFNDEKSCLDGAKQILMEQFSEDAALLAKIRHWLNKYGFIRSSLLETANKKSAQKYRDYFDFHELIGALAPRHVLIIAPYKDHNF